MGDAVALIKGGVKNLRRKDRRLRIEQIRASLGLSDSQRTPLVVYQYLLKTHYTVDHILEPADICIFYKFFVLLSSTTSRLCLVVFLPTKASLSFNQYIYLFHCFLNCFLLACKGRWIVERFLQAYKFVLANGSPWTHSAHWKSMLSLFFLLLYSYIIFPVKLYDW